MALRRCRGGTAQFVLFLTRIVHSSVRCVEHHEVLPQDKQGIVIADLLSPCYGFFFNLRLPDQPLMQLEPPTKKGKFSKSRVATPGKSVAKQTKNINHDSQSTSASSSGIQTDPQRRVCTTSSGSASNATTSSISVPQKHKSGVERVIVEQPMCNGDIRGQYVPRWDPYVMVETVSNVRLFPGNPILHSQAYMTSPVSNTSSSHCGVGGLRISNVTSLPMYSHKWNSLLSFQ